MYPIAELMTRSGPFKASRKLHEALAETKGLNMSTDHEGVLSVGAHAASLSVEPGGCIAANIAVENLPGPEQAMTVQSLIVAYVILATIPPPRFDTSSWPLALPPVIVKPSSTVLKLVLLRVTTL